MSLRTVAAEAALCRLDDASAVLDVRSPGEFALDHMPGASNWPVLDNAERARVGTLYQQQGAFEAKKVGAALVARNIARHLERESPRLARDWAPLVYCWRGGSRSGAMAHVLAQIGFRVTLVEGGYKALRAALVQNLEHTINGLMLRVLCGPTGSGKSRLLQALAQQGAQVLDLEALASHRGSVLGALPGQPQPPQKLFETQVWEQIRRFDPARTVWVESESRKIGQLYVPGPLLERMRAGACVRLEAPTEVRVAILLEDYAALTRDPEELSCRLASLTALRGRQTIARWHELIEAGSFPELVNELLQQHYDPSYDASIRRNFSRIDQAPSLVVGAPDAFANLAATLHESRAGRPASGTTAHGLQQALD